MYPNTEDFHELKSQPHILTMYKTQGLNILNEYIIITTLRTKLSCCTWTEALLSLHLKQLKFTDLTKMLKLFAKYKIKITQLNTPFLVDK